MSEAGEKINRNIEWVVDKLGNLLGYKRGHQDVVNLVSTQTDASGATVLAGAGGGLLRGPLVDGEWFTIPSLFRLRITGTGTVVIDAKDSLGNITTGVASYTVSGATDQIEFPYAGDDAVMIRATLTGTTAEVI